jgi:hypothetical protein
VDQVSTSQINKEKEEVEKLKNKIFVMENIMQLKNNTITLLKEKKFEKNPNLLDPVPYNRLYPEKNIKDREVFIIDPTKALLVCHDELQLYKDIYVNLNKQIKELNDSIKNKEKIITASDQQIQILKKALCQEKSSHEVLKREKSLQGQQENEVSKIIKPLPIKPNYINNNSKQESSVEIVNNKILTTNFSNNAMKTQMPLPSELRTSKSAMDINKNIYNSANFNYLNKLYSSSKYEDSEQTQLKLLQQGADPSKARLYCEEWQDCLKHCNMTNEEYVKLSKNRLLTKLIDAIEFFYKVVIEKNQQIQCIEKEIENLNEKNFNLNNENMSLYDRNLYLIKELDNFLNGNNEINNGRRSKGLSSKCIHSTTKVGDTQLDSSMANNTSRVTVYNNCNTIADEYNNYK